MRTMRTVRTRSFKTPQTASDSLTLEKLNHIFFTISQKSSVFRRFLLTYMQRFFFHFSSNTVQCVKLFNGVRRDWPKTKSNKKRRRVAMVSVSRPDPFKLVAKSPLLWFTPVPSSQAGNSTGECRWRHPRFLKRVRENLLLLINRNCGRPSGGRGPAGLAPGC